MPQILPLFPDYINVFYDLFGGGKYHCEMTLQDHEELINILLNLKGKVVLSGYNHPCYTVLEDNGWQRIEFQTACSAAGRTKGTGILGKGSAKQKQPRTDSRQ